MELSVTEVELNIYKSGSAYIQDVFPHLSPGEREFLMTGITPEEWKTCLGEDDENCYMVRFTWKLFVQHP